MQYYTELTGDKGKKPEGKPGDESMKNKADRLKEKIKKNEEDKKKKEEL